MAKIKLMARIRLVSCYLVGMFACLTVAQTQALKLSEFAAMCEALSGDGHCSQHQVVQAYVGGALDLVAALGEHTTYLSKIYCRDPREIFDVAKIVDYMLEAPLEDRDSNAMLAVIRYLEEEGDCA